MNSRQQTLRTGVILSVLIFIFTTSSWSTEDSNVILDQNYTIVADNEPIRWVINRVRSQFDDRICFEQIHIDEVRDCITAFDIYRELTEAKKQRELTVRQNDLLKKATEHVEKNEDEMPLAWEEHILNGEFTAPTLPLLLDQLLEGSPYGWYEENGTYVILPRQGSRLQYPVTIDVENVLLSDVIEIVVSQAPEGIPIQKGDSVVTGITSYSQDVWQHVRAKKDGMKIVRLVMQNEPAMTVLNRAVESSGGQVVWTLTGNRNELLTRPLRGLQERWIEEIVDPKVTNE